MFLEIELVEELLIRTKEVELAASDNLNELIVGPVRILLNVHLLMETRS